jgi:hypothetical protein
MNEGLKRSRLPEGRDIPAGYEIPGRVKRLFARAGGSPMVYCGQLEPGGLGVEDIPPIMELQPRTPEELLALGETATQPLSRPLAVSAVGGHPGRSLRETRG